VHVDDPRTGLLDLSENHQRSKSARLSQTEDCWKASGSSIERVSDQLLAPKAGIRAAAGSQMSSQRSARNGAMCQSSLQTSAMSMPPPRPGSRYQLAVFPKQGKTQLRKVFTDGRSNISRSKRKCRP
jgi:hypothetical protein